MRSPARHPLIDLTINLTCSMCIKYSVNKMARKLCMLALLAVLTFFCWCDTYAGYGGKLSISQEAHVDFSDQTLMKFDEDLSPLLFRYLAGNPRWEIREERGLRYAVRIERVHGAYQTTLNGFYSTYVGGAVLQTRVLISFGDAYGFGRERGNITRTPPGEKDVPLIIESERAGTPGYSSYTIVSGGKVFLEIYDQAPNLARSFTQRAFNEVSAELANVIEHRTSIEKSGILPVQKHYPIPLPTKRFLEIKDGLQPGIYLITAAVSPIEPGYAYIKVFNSKTGKRLSKERLTPRSVRYLGWSDEGGTLFHYGSEVTVYEGDWSYTYEARFELWHRSDAGVEKKLSEKTRMINGWQR